MNSIYVGSSVYRTAEFMHIACINALLSRGGTDPRIIYHPEVGDALIERSRAILATRFLQKSDADVLLMVDGDILFKPEDALMLCAEAVETQSIVVGVYVTRSAGNGLCFPATFFEPEVPVHFGEGHQLTPVRWGTTGFMAIARSVVERMTEHPECNTLLHQNHLLGKCFYPFFTPFQYQLPETGEWILLSEDYAFCERAKSLGITTYCDPGVRLQHLGLYAYEVGDMAMPEKYQGPLVVKRRPDGKHEGYAPEAPKVAELYIPEGAHTRSGLREAAPVPA